MKESLWVIFISKSVLDLACRVRTYREFYTLMFFQKISNEVMSTDFDYIMFKNTGAESEFLPEKGGTYYF